MNGQRLAEIGNTLDALVSSKVVVFIDDETATFSLEQDETGK